MDFSFPCSYDFCVLSFLSFYHDSLGKTANHCIPESERGTMNKTIMYQYMKNGPADTRSKYLFLVEDKDIALNICLVGSSAQAILDCKDETAYFNLEEFLNYMESISNTGTSQIDFTYVLCLSTRNRNDRVEEYCRNNHLNFKNAWQLFRNKEYCGKTNYIDTVREIIKNYIDRQEGPDGEGIGIDRSVFHIYGKNDVPKGVYDGKVVDYLMTHVRMFVIGSTPYLYAEGVYRKDPDGSSLRSHIRELLFDEFRNSTIINRIYRQLIDQPFLKKTINEINLQPRRWVNFQNGYFDPVSWTLIKHDPKYLTINQIPMRFDPGSWPRPDPPDTASTEDTASADKALENPILHKPHLIDRFLETAISDPDNLRMLWEYCGYCFTADTSMQKFLMITGKGGTGKSVVIDLITSVIGSENCSAVTLQNLNERFYPSCLFGMLLNACADIPSTAMENVDGLKKATGEDLMIYERKGENPSFYHSYAKLLFSANEMPLNLDDRTNAYYRRMLVIEMSHVVSAEENDLDLKSKLYEERDYFLFRAMEGLHQLYTQGRFTQSRSSQAHIEELRRSADSIQAFLYDRIMVKEGSRIARSSMYESYKNYCEENDRRPYGKSVFFRRMKDIQLKKTSAGFFYMNVDFKEDDFVEVDAEEEVPFS